LLLASFHEDRFIPFVRLEHRVGDWNLEGSDRLVAGNFDDDPELEILAQKTNVYGILDFFPTPRSSFVARLDASTLTFRAEHLFRRGDANSDDEVDISDVVTILSSLFLGIGIPMCHDAADVDDSGAVDISDPVFLLQFLFNRGDVPPSPGPFQPGIDVTEDRLDCATR
jgi:hypothetical protein